MWHLLHDRQTRSLLLGGAALAVLITCLLIACWHEAGTRIRTRLDELPGREDQR